MISWLSVCWVDLDYPREGITPLSADFGFCPQIPSEEHWCYVLAGHGFAWFKLRLSFARVGSGSRVGCCTDLGLSQACTIFSKCVKEMCTRFTFQSDSQSFTVLPWICVICAERRGQVAYCVISQNWGPVLWLSLSLHIPYSFFPEGLPYHIPLTDKREYFLWNSLLPLLLL